MAYDAFTLATLSAAVYDDIAAETFLARVVGYTPARHFKKNDTQATLFIGKNGERPVLAIRGTEFGKSWTDFFRNIGWPVSWSGPGKVHRGYLRGYNMIRDDVLALASEFPNLILTGHSLGGSTATIAGAHVALRGNGGKDVSVVTFGAPPCVNKELAQLLEIERYIVANDFAPKIPGWVVGLVHPQGPVVKLSKLGPLAVSVRAHLGSVYMDKLEDRSEYIALRVRINGVPIV